ncbi:hypothetical protein FA95DRAFT_1207284 [Auriscalpium vulgare]|uniref:Uncharacterized protein n=1 Tax=Auriscalpium vulgare TaxID=40419 RepID=A0ACB8RUX3_9AGAM|nr:hypothetical protein FA95DRAFT_1207284 [Auriscalpium vulgare]
MRTHIAHIHTVTCLSFNPLSSDEARNWPCRRYAAFFSSDAVQCRELRARLLDSPQLSRPVYSSDALRHAFILTIFSGHSEDAPWPTPPTTLSPPLCMQRNEASPHATLVTDIIRPLDAHRCMLVVRETPGESADVVRFAAASRNVQIGPRTAEYDAGKRRRSTLVP